MIRILPTNPDHCPDLQDKVYFARTDFKVLRGEEHLRSGEVVFPHALHHFLPEIDDGYYRTAFFANIDHNGRIFADCDQSLRYAARRLLALREPPDDFESATPSLERYQNWHTHSRVTQSSFIDNSQHFLRALLNHTQDVYTTYTDVLEMAQECHDLPHDKRELRIQAWLDLVEGGEVATDHWLRKVLYKLKKFEWAKPGKYPRAIGDLGVSASLLGFMLSDFVKAGMARDTFEYKGCESRFIKRPTQSALVEVFHNLLYPARKMYFAYFSDDSCISIRVGNDVYVYNLDISSCDASHGPKVFEALVNIVPESIRGDMRRVVGQLETRVYLQSQSKRKEDRIYIQMDEPTLFSGSTLTTVLNNVACLLMFKSFTETTFVGTREEVGNQLKEAAEKVGYKITIESCLEMGHIQFLKNSPVYDTDGNMRSLLNIGVLLRLTGLCHGDLPGRGDLEPRARNFQANLLRGAYPRAHFALIDRMKTSCGPIESTLDMDKQLRGKLRYQVVDSIDDEEFYVDSLEICKRYGLCLSKYQELEELLGGAGCGEVVACEAADTILKADYALRVSW